MFADAEAEEEEEEEAEADVKNQLRGAEEEVEVGKRWGRGRKRKRNGLLTSSLTADYFCQPLGSQLGGVTVTGAEVGEEVEVRRGRKVKQTETKLKRARSPTAYHFQGSRKSPLSSSLTADYF